MLCSVMEVYQRSREFDYPIIRVDKSTESSELQVDFCSLWHHYPEDNNFYNQIFI